MRKIHHILLLFIPLILLALSFLPNGVGAVWMHQENGEFIITETFHAIISSHTLGYNCLLIFSLIAYLLTWAGYLLYRDYPKRFLRRFIRIFALIGFSLNLVQFIAVTRFTWVLAVYSLLGAGFTLLAVLLPSTNCKEQHENLS